MGKTVGERGRLMHSGPSKTAEAIVAAFVPPACREEVLGDLHERYSSAGQYALDAVRAIPLVIFSRIRRTADPQLLLMQAFALYASFLGAAWLNDRAFLTEQWGLLRLAIPAATVIIGMILADAYAKSGWRSSLNSALGPALGVVLALASQGTLRITDPALAVPNWIMLYGCAISFLLSSAIRMLFPPTTRQFQRINVPAHRLKQSGDSRGNPKASTRRATLPKPWVVTLLSALLLVLLIAYQVWKRG